MDVVTSASVVDGIGLEKAVKPQPRSSRPHSCKPFAARPFSARPSSGASWYVHDAACALGEDALRFERKILGGAMSPDTIAELRGLRESASPTSCPSCGCSTNLSGVPSAVDLWRRAFHAEAMECVHSMQAVIDANKTSSFATRFDEWRKIDLKSTAQVQQHVKELMRLNQSVEQFLSDCGSLSSLQSFKDSFLALNRCVDELSAARKDYADCIDTIAERTAERVVVNWREQYQEAARTAHEEWTAEQQRWCKLDLRLDELQNNMIQLGDTVRKSSSTNLEAFKCHTGDILTGSGGVKDFMNFLDKRMAAWETATNQELVQSRETAENMTAQVHKLEKSSLAAQKKFANAEEAWQETEATLNGLVLKLQSDLSMAQEAVQLAEAGSLRTNMMRLKNIESRGVVRLNRESGQIKTVAPIEFAAVKAGGPADVTLINPSLLQNAAQDVVELSNIFDGPLIVEAHTKQGRGATPAFWDDVATRQAELVVDKLQQNGVPAERLVAKGLAGKKGQNANIVLLQLDKDLFPNIAEPAAAKPRRGQR